MIKFEAIRWKNFLSTGNDWTEIDLNQTSTTLIVGHNGSGKSTFLDALSFTLFGKAHRNVNKAQLVNSINNKACVTEVEFQTLGSHFKVIRGIKPAKFEIWQNGEVINQDSHAKEYQKLLEQNILKLNHKSFHQVVVLGSSSFIPFMQLSAQARREVIEDLLDINVFSRMNGLLKERNSILKSDVQQAVTDLGGAEYKRSTQEEFVRKLTALQESAKQAKQEEIDHLESLIKDIESNMAEIDSSSLRQHEAEMQKLSEKVTGFKSYDHQFSSKQRELNSEIEFYENNTTCPTCDQSIDQGLKQDKKEAASRKWDKLEESRHQASAQIEKLTDMIQSIRGEVEEINSRLRKMDQQRVQINEHRNAIKRIQDTIAKEKTGDDLTNALADLERLKQSESEARSTKLSLAEKALYHQAVTEILKDTGIKTKIIKQYVPVMNKLINKYLQVLDFFVSFHLDDTFKESIRSRHRDEFSYDSFSEGEKQRIDLALLFTWRQIAKMKNSVATNLLLLDETFDSSLDADGVENLLMILDTLDNDTNVFVISHKGELLDNKFDRTITFSKEKNFSQIS